MKTNQKISNQKGSITMIVLVIILVAVSVGGYMYVQKNKVVKEVVEVVEVVEVTEGEPVSAVQFEDGFMEDEYMD